MLSPKTQTNLKNAKSYFDEHLAIGDYYAESNRVLGEWIGEGAETLGLAGIVEQQQLVRLCESASANRQTTHSSAEADEKIERRHE